MIESETLLEFLRKRAKRPLRPKELAKALGVRPAEYSQLRRLLRQLERSGEIYRVRRGRYAVPERIHLAVGRLQITRGGQGFVVPDDGAVDVFIPAAALGNAYDGDRVVARVERRRRGRNPEGSVVRVLERARGQVVGRFHRSGSYAYVEATEGLHRDVWVPADYQAGAEDGQLVVARIVDWGSDHLDPVGEVAEILGRPGEPGVDVLAIVHRHELASDLAPEVLEDAERIARQTAGEAVLDERMDLRGVLSFTIDPSDAKDHDDAVSIEQLAHGRCRLGVHIADVAYFVGEGTPTDLEARRRGTSVYLVDRVLPMLPERLSTDLCSLKPDRDRLTLSVLLELDEKAEVRSTELVASVIRSRRALSYEEAQAIIDGELTGGRELGRALRQLRDVSATLRERRRSRGSLDFDLPEARVVVNAAGEPTAIQRLLRLDSHRLIEELMILANESMARLAKRRGLPFLYRIHEAPDPERLDRLLEFVESAGLPRPKGMSRTPKALQKLLDSVEGRPEEAVVSMLTLRSMKQARYSAEPRGHFGLASPAYTHFTSPIRRYPDLVVHRILRQVVLEGGSISEALGEELASIAQHASLRERQAEEAERDSVELKKMEYMERHLGDDFEGTVSGVAPFGLFVLLDDVWVEGLIHVSQLGDDYYELVEEEHALVGEVRRRRYRLGDRVRVRVLSVDRESQRLDLGLEAPSGTS